MSSTDLQITLGSEGSGDAGCDLGALWLDTWGRGTRKGRDLNGCEFVGGVTG